MVILISSNSSNSANSVPSRKPKAVRAFQGLAGSPLAKVAAPRLETEPELIARLTKEAKSAAKHRERTAKLQRKFDKKLADLSKSDHTLRVPKSPDREDPVSFDVWFDDFGQRHGQIDLDCGFQEYPFDPHLKHGANPDGVETIVREGADTSERAHILDVFGVDIDAPKNERIGVRTGLLPGQREEKPRRATKETWWIFDLELFKDFVKEKWDEDGIEEAEKCIWVLHSYYYRSRSDQEVFGEAEGDNLTETPGFFPDVKSCKSYRQFVVRQGAKAFSHLKNRADFAPRSGRRGKMRGMRCKDPKCTQCWKNEVDIDFRF